MLVSEIIFEKLTNVTFDNAISKMAAGFKYGRTLGADTCYAYVGEWLKNHPNERDSAIIRLWGLQATQSREEIIVHGDAVLPNGQVISDMPTDRYLKGQMQLVKVVPFEQFVKLLPG
jgi:hypothetical protein